MRINQLWEVRVIDTRTVLHAFVNHEGMNGDTEARNRWENWLCTTREDEQEAMT